MAVVWGKGPLGDGIIAPGGGRHRESSGAHVGEADPGGHAPAELSKVFFFVVVIVVTAKGLRARGGINALVGLLPPEAPAGLVGWSLRRPVAAAGVVSGHHARRRVGVVARAIAIARAMMRRRILGAVSNGRLRQVRRAPRRPPDCRDGRRRRARSSVRSGRLLRHPHCDDDDDDAPSSSPLGTLRRQNSAPRQIPSIARTSLLTPPRLSAGARGVTPTSFSRRQCSSNSSSRCRPRKKAKRSQLRPAGEHPPSQC